MQDNSEGANTKQSDSTNNSATGNGAPAVEAATATTTTTAAGVNQQLQPQQHPPPTLVSADFAVLQELRRQHDEILVRLGPAAAAQHIHNAASALKSSGVLPASLEAGVGALVGAEALAGSLPPAAAGGTTPAAAAAPPTFVQLVPNGAGGYSAVPLQTSALQLQHQHQYLIKHPNGLVEVRRAPAPTIGALLQQQQHHQQPPSSTDPSPPLTQLNEPGATAQEQEEYQNETGENKTDDNDDAASFPRDDHDHDDEDSIEVVGLTRRPALNNNSNNNNKRGDDFSMADLARRTKAPRLMTDNHRHHHHHRHQGDYHRPHDRYMDAAQAAQIQNHRDAHMNEQLKKRYQTEIKGSVVDRPYPIPRMDELLVKVLVGARGYNVDVLCEKNLTLSKEQLRNVEALMAKELQHRAGASEQSARRDELESEVIRLRHKLARSAVHNPHAAVAHHEEVKLEQALSQQREAHRAQVAKLERRHQAAVTENEALREKLRGQETKWERELFEQKQEYERALRAYMKTAIHSLHRLRKSM